MTLHSDHASILSIRPRNNIVLSKGGRPINPHKVVWNRHKAPSTPITSIAFALDQDEPASLEIQLLSGRQKLEGKTRLEALDDNRNLLFSGEINGLDLVLVKAQVSKERLPQRQSRAIHWQLSLDSEEKISLGTTLIEVFWVNISSSTYVKGIPVEALRKIYSGHKTEVKQSFRLLINQHVQNIFNRVPPSYDTNNGAPRYITWNSWDNITLDYNYYQYEHSAGLNVRLNCYDAASILQYEMRIDGYQNVQYCFMQPFGYLKLTDLIGVIVCNNPFFEGNGTDPYINEYDVRRTAFGNHAFVEVDNSFIGDACAGPHIGNENAEAYVRAAIDTEVPANYQDPYGNIRSAWQSGGVGNIGRYQGVNQQAVQIAGLHEPPNLLHTESFKRKINFSLETVQGYVSVPQAIAGKWPEPIESPLLNNRWTAFFYKKWTTSYEEIVPGLEENLKIWVLRNGKQTITIKLYVISGNKNLAFNRFLALGSLSQCPECPYDAGPDQLGHYSAVSLHKGCNRCFWVFHNVVLDIVTSNSSVNILSLAQWYYQWSTQNITENLSENLPLADINYSSLQPKVGDRLYVSLASDENAMLDIVKPQAGLRLISQAGGGLLFDVLPASEYSLEVLVIDRDTLLVTSQVLQLNAQFTT